MTSILSESYSHYPVMLTESINNLDIKEDGIYVDGTIGLGGHSIKILEYIKKGFLIGFDRDSNSIKIAKKRLSIFDNFELIHSSYTNLDDACKKLNIKKFDGILLDLGLSSFQLEDNQRGFSHRYDSSLDMRFDDTNEGLTAEEIINSSSIKELTDIFNEFGEERNSFRIARAIKESKEEINAETLVSIISRMTAYKYRIKTYSRIFQALRIKTNDELEHLESFLDDFMNFLKPNGRIVIISYHSMEDRMVKHKFKSLKLNKELKVLSKKPFTPTDQEISDNRRSRSAKMRVGEKIG
ncbi:MAG: 16S rRNA (cytosine(1402)-N(4))-methyltransferase RsmH [Candidatus Marinimicrobia bacterium]|jgi:16S rRNA (cytosine1402-N4)-methyltransferase|nr:16S rRNA (cytosine(1402)-N(4))-methyltransferase RsmH [Candidatus Neomarinimicrobiota bacterium]